MSLRYSCNSEASELLEYLEEMFPQHHMESAVINRFKSLPQKGCDVVMFMYLKISCECEVNASGS